MGTSLEAEANQLGIPMKMIVDDGLRYYYCDAHEATLVSIDGDKATYKGECANRHKYEMTYEIEELQQMYSIVDGEIQIGGDKGFVAGDLREL